MRWSVFCFFVAVCVGAVLVFGYGQQKEGLRVRLPQPRVKGAMSVEEAIYKRRSRRSFRDEALTLEQVGQLLWAAQGITDKRSGFRAAPSAGATYPLEVYLVAGKVKDLKCGVYRYDPHSHSLELHKAGDVRVALSRAALGQAFIRTAPATVVIAAVERRTAARYGARAKRYVLIEVGHAGQNIYLQAEALGLGTVAVGAYHDEQVQRVLNLDIPVLYLMPVGKVR